MILDALSPGDALGVRAELDHHFSRDIQDKAKKMEESDAAKPEADRKLLNYYWSPKSPSQARLLDHLFESAWFSQALYFAAWIFSLLCMGVFLGG